MDKIKYPPGSVKTEEEYFAANKLYFASCTTPIHRILSGEPSRRDTDLNTQYEYNFKLENDARHWWTPTGEPAFPVGYDKHVFAFTNYWFALAHALRGRWP